MSFPFREKLGESTLESVIFGVLYWMLERLGFVPYICLIYPTDGPALTSTEMMITQGEGPIIFSFVLVFVLLLVKYFIYLGRGKQL